MGRIEEIWCSNNRYKKEAKKETTLVKFKTKTI